MRMLSLDQSEPVADIVAPYRATRRPSAGHSCWVLANMVGGLDGSAAIGGRVGELSEGVDAELFRSLRSVADVVLVGAETVRREGYGPVRLDGDRQRERHERGAGPVPPIAVVTRSIDLDWDSALFTEAAAGTIAVTCEAAGTEAIERAREHATVLVAGEASVDLGEALRQLAELGLHVVLCEGGPTLLGRVAADGLLDEFCLTIAPVMGGDPLPVAITPPGADTTGFALRHIAVDRDTLLLRYEVDRRG